MVKHAIVTGGTRGIGALEKCDDVREDEVIASFEELKEAMRK